MENGKGTIAIIGGGAAGFFAAVTAQKESPSAKVILFEKAAKVLAKVKISGGGRCNVTHACFDNRELATRYPRGESFLRKCFPVFNAQSTIDWFESRGVKMHTYPDGCIFPEANDSQVIIDCLHNEARRLGVKILTETPIDRVEMKEGLFLLQGRTEQFFAEKIIVTIGGQPKRSGLEWLEKLGHTIVEPVPSLFTFNMPGNPIVELMGNVVEKASAKIEGAKLLGRGPLLVTHWGMSGPAVLQLSAWGARLLEEKKYQFAILVNWLDTTKEDTLRTQIAQVQEDHGAKMIANLNPFPMTNRLWSHLLTRADIHPETRWRDLGKKPYNRLINTLLNDRYEVSGKTTFKEEFVTAGGISLAQIDHRTMESKVVPNLYFAGEVMDIDGITGGFNFQAAWTTGYIAGKSTTII